MCANRKCCTAQALLGAVHDESAAGTSEIVLDDDYLDGIDLTGKELVVSIPNDPVDAYRVARVVRNTANTLWINDPGTYSAGDAIDAGRDFVVYDFEGSVQEASVDFAVSSTNYPGSPDETEVQCDAYEHALGWSAVGETGGAIVVGAISGYAYIFPGDQTENFLVTMTYQVTPLGHSARVFFEFYKLLPPTWRSSNTIQRYYRVHGFDCCGSNWRGWSVGGHDSGFGVPPNGFGRSAPPAYAPVPPSQGENIPASL